MVGNADPLGQGRVTVRFDWQLHDTTDFIRIMSPDAGGTDQVTQNRGYVAIPEVGDQVMVGFVHNHPDRPFVMGGMFHGGTSLGGGVNNHMRSIQTKSGIKVLMNDDEKSVTILDPSGNTYFMDGNGNIEVTAPKNITFNAGENLDINVGQNMSTNVGANINTSAGNNITENAGMDVSISANLNFHQTATNDYSLMAANIIQFAKKEFMSQSEILTKTSGKIQAMATLGNITFNAKGEIKDDSGEKSKSH